MECSICLDEFKNPRILLCGHSFCEECLFAQIKLEKVVCPECRSIFAVKKNEIPKNIALIHLIEEHKQTLQQKSLTNLKPENFANNPPIYIPQVQEGYQTPYYDQSYYNPSPPYYSHRESLPQYPSYDPYYQSNPNYYAYQQYQNYPSNYNNYYQ